MHFPIFAVFLLTNEIVTQELTLCPLPKINSQCVLTCKTADLRKKVSFNWKGNTVGSCEILFNGTECHTFNNNFLISINESARETSLTINSLDETENEGSWHCEYGNRRSKSKMLQLYDIIYNTSLVTEPVFNKREDFIGFLFQTDCLMPEPTISPKCKNGDEMCKVSPFEKRKCEKPSLRIYNVTCNTTAECFLEKKLKVEIKVYDNIIGHKIIIYKKNEVNENGTSSHDGISIMLLLIIIILSLTIIVAVIKTLKYRDKVVTNCGKKDGFKSKQNNHEDGQEEEVKLYLE